MDRFRFARRPRWVLSHVLVLLLVIVMINLGFWQLRRLHERRASNALITARASQPPAGVGDLVPLSSDDVKFRSVRAFGEYDASRSHVVGSRTQSGGPGGWVVTPMRAGDHAVLVLRGFERLSPDGGLPTPAAPSGVVEVDGYALPLNSFDPIAKHDLEDMARASTDVAPFVVQARSSAPTDDAELEPVPLPDLGEGPHLGYAVQWFIFSAIAVIGYPIILQREARRQAVADVR